MPSFVQLADDNSPNVVALRSICSGCWTRRIAKLSQFACCVGSYRFCAKHLADSGDTISRERESTVSRGSVRVAANSCPVSRREEGIEPLNTLHFGPDTKVARCHQVIRGAASRHRPQLCPVLEPSRGLRPVETLDWYSRQRSSQHTGRARSRHSVRSTSSPTTLRVGTTNHDASCKSPAPGSGASRHRRCHPAEG